MADQPAQSLIQEEDECREHVFKTVVCKEDDPDGPREYVTYCVLCGYEPDE